MPPSILRRNDTSALDTETTATVSANRRQDNTYVRAHPAFGYVRDSAARGWRRPGTRDCALARELAGRAVRLCRQPESGHRRPRRRLRGTRYDQPDSRDDLRSRGRRHAGGHRTRGGPRRRCRRRAGRRRYLHLRAAGAGGAHRDGQGVPAAVHAGTRDPRQSGFRDVRGHGRRLRVHRRVRRRPRGQARRADRR